MRCTQIVCKIYLDDAILSASDKQLSILSESTAVRLVLETGISPPDFLSPCIIDDNLLADGQAQQSHIKTILKRLRRAIALGTNLCCEVFLMLALQHAEVKLCLVIAQYKLTGMIICLLLSLL